MIKFSDLTKQMHLINDMIISDMVCEESADDASSFTRHLLTTKNWFSRISWSNKKRYVLALLEDVRSAWTLSLLLKSLWNCRPKDSVLSISEKTVWSSFDEVPTDHNRTAQPTSVLAQVMKSDRHWFIALESEEQAIVLAELLTVSGGPVMWAVLRRAEVLYQRYRQKQLQSLQESNIADEPPPIILTGKRDSTNQKTSEGASQQNAAKSKAAGPAQSNLEARLAEWNATIKSMKDSLKLEELEMSCSDGTHRKIWMVNRPKPEAIETVDYIQLLPSSIGKIILSYLPQAQLNECTHVNKYWAYLVDDYKAEMAARLKINTDFDRLNEIMLRHDILLDLVEPMDIGTVGLLSSIGYISTAMSTRFRPLPSVKTSLKSAGAYSLRHFLSDKLNKDFKTPMPIRNMTELSKRLNQRGAVDENLWDWCENILKNVPHKPLRQEGILTFGNIYFPCPLMKQFLEVPLNTPLYKDPANIVPLKRRNMSVATALPTPKELGVKRYSLWTRDFSRLYPIIKIPSYHSFAYLNYPLSYK